jgi:hypothetical protein
MKIILIRHSIGKIIDTYISGEIYKLHRKKCEILEVSHNVYDVYNVLPEENRILRVINPKEVIYEEGK